MKKGTGIKNTPIDEVFDKLQPYTESDPLVLQVIGNTVNALMSAFKTSYNSAWKLTQRLINEFDVNLLDGRDLQGNYPYKWAKLYLHNSKKAYGDIHDLELFAIEHGIELTKRHCDDKIKYNRYKTANMPRFNNRSLLLPNGRFTH